MDMYLLLLLHRSAVSDPAANLSTCQVVTCALLAVEACVCEGTVLAPPPSGPIAEITELLGTPENERSHRTLCPCCECVVLSACHPTYET